MKRKIIEIDDSKCDGCGICIDACPEGALALVGGKARLVSDIYCDGLGACIGECPQGALKIIEREAPDFDAAAVEAARKRSLGLPHSELFVVKNSCPGSTLRTNSPAAAKRIEKSAPARGSSLSHWPVQLMLVPPNAPFLPGANILVCADCVPFALADFHERFLAGRVVLVGCPKLDDLEHYRDKLAAMFRQARPRQVTVARMEVPCCRGIALAATEAARSCEPAIAVEEYIVGVGGSVEPG